MPTFQSPRLIFRWGGGLFSLVRSFRTFFDVEEWRGLGSKKAHAAPDRARRICTVVDIGPYRGLLPHQPLIYSSRGDGMSQNTRRRVLENVEKKAYRACD